MFVPREGAGLERESSRDDATVVRRRGNSAAEAREGEPGSGAGLLYGCLRVGRLGRDW